MHRRSLQQALDQEGVSLVEVLYEELGERMGLLMTNQFGNYLFQKIVEMSSDQQRRRLVGEGRRVQRSSRWCRASFARPPKTCTERAACRS